MRINIPSVLMFASPFEKSEVTDELLYGTEVEVIDRMCGCVRVITDYGYKGWIDENAVAEWFDTPNATVKQSFCDLLPTERYKYAPVMTLPKGSRVIAAVPHEVPGRAMILLNDKRMFFVNENAIMFDGDFRTESCKGCTKRCALLNRAPEKITREGVAAVAESYLGTQYRWGGKTAAGIDCSGLAFMSYFMNGVRIYRDAEPEKQTKFVNIPLEEARMGDLLFFEGHVAISLGEGRFIHSTAGKGGVVYGDVESDKGLFKTFITAMKYKDFE